MQTTNLKFSLFTLVTVMSIVACTNNNGKLSVTPRGTPQDQQKATACVDSLKPSTQKKVAGKQPVMVCELPVSAQSSAKPVAVAHPVSYAVYAGEDPAAKATRASSNKVHLKMLIGFEETKTTLNKDNRDDWRKILADDCGQSIAGIFERSADNGLQLALNLNYTVVDPTTNNDGISDPDEEIPDHTLMVTRVSDPTTNDVSWEFAQIPSRPHFYAVAKAADVLACNGTGGDLKTCKKEKRKAANIPMCAAIAKRVGNTLGIVDAAGENALCGAVQPAPVTVAATPAPTATPTATSDIDDASFEITQSGDIKPAAKPNPSGGDSSFSKPTGKDDEWLGKATLNHKDVVTIMSPVCADIK